MRSTAPIVTENLEGQPDWQIAHAQGRLRRRRMTSRPHLDHDRPGPVRSDKYGLARHAPPGYQSDMPAFEGTLTR